MKFAGIPFDSSPDEKLESFETERFVYFDSANAKSIYYLLGDQRNTNAILLRLFPSPSPSSIMKLLANKNLYLYFNH